MNRLRQTRFEKKKSQLKIYKETGIFPSYISWIESGRLNPTETEKTKIANCLGVEKDWLFPKKNH